MEKTTAEKIRKIISKDEEVIVSVDGEIIVQGSLEFICRTIGNLMSGMIEGTKKKYKDPDLTDFTKLQFRTACYYGGIFTPNEGESEEERNKRIQDEIEASDITKEMLHGDRESALTKLAEKIIGKRDKKEK